MSAFDLPMPDYVVLDGLPVATRVLEPASASAGDVVFCHGTPWSSRVWAPVARALSGEYRVFLWDMPGYGESIGGAPRVELRAQMARFSMLCEAWGLVRPHVVAHDIGGAVALGAHLLHGVDFADLFLWDAVALEPWGSDFFRLVAAHTEVFRALPARLHGALVAEYIAGAAARELSSDELEILARPWSGQSGQGAFYDQIAALDPCDIRPLVERLGRVRCPVRIGWGADDPWIPVGQAFELRDRLQGSPEVVVVDGVGHLVPIENPQSVVNALQDWLRRSL